MLITSEDAEYIISELKSVIDRDINIMDKDGIIIASTNPERVKSLHTGARKLLRENLDILVISDNDNLEGARQGVNLPIYIDGKCEGVIGITGDPREVSIFGEIIRKMTVIMIMRIRQQQESALLERAKNLFLEEWLFSDSLDWAEFETRGNLLGIDISLPRSIAILEPILQEHSQSGAASTKEVQSSRLVQIIEQHLREQSQNLCAVVNRRIIILFCGESVDITQQKLDRIRVEIHSFYSVMLCGGLSSQSKNPKDLRRCYTEARIALQVALRASGGAILCYNNASLEFILQNIDAKVKQDMLQVVFSACSESSLSELMKFLKLYFKYDGNLELAAQEACVHRNTLQYRIGKITKLTGYDLRKPKDAVMLYLAQQFYEGSLIQEQSKGCICP